MCDEAVVIRNGLRDLMKNKFVNITGYKFIEILDKTNLQLKFREFCFNHELLGTILLSNEGINFFLSGQNENINSFLEFLDNDERFKSIPIKKSFSEKCSFRKMNVRLKKEIISMGKDDINPSINTGEKISPKEFRHWLEEKKDIIILDTRNDYEIRLGSFQNSENLNLSTFRGFPEAVSLSSLDREKTVVMYCTGGIRCEKASAEMLNQGFKDVRQLDGGILGYFESVGGDYWNGDCFVFDRRVAVDSELNETNIEVCYACREPLNLDELSSKKYVIGESCPYCYDNEN